MVAGDQVPGGHSGNWAFVTADLHDINTKVREMDPDARLVLNRDTGVTGLAVFVRREHLGPGDLEKELQAPVQATGGFWLVVLRGDQQWPEVATTEPTDLVLERIRSFDNRRRRDTFSAKRWVDYCKQEARKVEKRLEDEAREKITEATERMFVAGRKKKGIKAPRIWVPGSPLDAA